MNGEDMFGLDKSPSVITDDVRNLIILADELEDKCERGMYRLRMYALFELALMLVVVAASIWFGFNARGLGLWPVPAVLLTGGLYVAVTHFTLVMKVSSKLRKDARALKEVVLLLREVGDTAAKRGNWSEMERAQFRIQLSRFSV